MPRSLHKGPFVDSFVQSVLTRDESALSSNVRDIRVWSRRSFILPSFVGKKCAVYNGRNFVSLLISEEMIGHKFGEFAVTRKKGVHKKKGKKK